MAVTSPGACRSTQPVGLDLHAGASLADGTYCWHVRAFDEDGGTSVFSSTRTVTIDATAPNVAITFPVNGSNYSETSWNAGCSTVVGDFCGTASDATSGLLSVQVSMRRVSTGLWWDWNAVTPSFSSSTEVFFSVGTAATWNRSFPFANFPATGQYTVHARATDNATNTTDVTSTFQLNRYTIDYLPPLDDSTPTLIVKNTGKNGRVIPVKVDVFLEGVKQTSTHIPEGDLTIGVNLMASCTSDALRLGRGLRGCWPVERRDQLVPSIGRLVDLQPRHQGAWRW